MTVFGVDTAGRTASVAIIRDDELIYETFCNTGLTHSETLLPMVDGSLKACGLTCADVDVWGVTAGPGSFTGLRIGLAAVKGLAFARNTPCAGVSTLEALARCYTGAGTVIPALDARRGQVYWAAFDLESHARLASDDAAPADCIAEFLPTCKKPVFFVGDGAALCYNKFGQQPGVLACPPALRCTRGAGVALAALDYVESGRCVPPAQLLPSYHRLSQAERERAEREAARTGQEY
ncbi:MAG: tRNA (adenosine(37)-N6)-threonylcarbamoyltransferase complex dimerization subunit type 1 TsaB [Gemmiger sp.]